MLVGVDLGGTNIRAAVATGAATHAQAVTIRTPAAEGPEAVLAAVASAVRSAAGAGASLRGVAIGIPGPLDPASGVVHAAPHLAGWSGVPAGRMLSELTGCPVEIRNDAHLAGYAEWVAGAGGGVANFVFITVSTGIGGCLVVEGELLGGAAGTAGEIGHAPCGFPEVVCGQGHRGCLEGVASGTAIAERARWALSEGQPSSLAEVAVEALDARAVQEAAGRGDRLARRLFDEAGRELGRAVGGLINLLSPELVVVGGGLIQAAGLLLEPLAEGVAELAFKVPASRCRILPASLGTDAGLVGAVAWAMRCFAGNPPFDEAQE